MAVELPDIGRAIFAESPDALFLFDPDSEDILDVNPAAIKLSGFTHADLLKLPATHWVRFSGGEQGDEKRMRQAAAHTAKHFSHDGYYLRTTNEKVWIPVNLSISRLHVLPKTLALMAARDMRAQRDADEQLRRQAVRLREGEVRLQAILDHSPAVIYVKDLQGKYLLINRQYEELFHITRELIKGKTDFEVFPIPFAEAFTSNDRKVLSAGRPLECEEIAPHDDGPHTYISIKFPIRDSFGNTYALCGISTDISERKRLEDERNLSLEQARQLATELEKAVASERAAHQQLKETQSNLVQTEKLAALGQMVAGVAHEINNPLAYVSTNTSVAERDAAALRHLVQSYRQGKECLQQHQPDLHQRIQQIEDDIDADYILANLEGVLSRSRDGLKRIQQIVKDLREFARLDSGDQSEVDINTGIQSTLNIVRGQARKKNIELHVELAKLPRILCHAAKINQVILNLLSNAIDATPVNGHISIATRSTQSAVQIHVQDSGAGVPESIRGRIFDPFFTTKPPGQGTGLGLSISHSIVRDHGGTIWVEPGEGAHFVVELPARTGKLP